MVSAINLGSLFSSGGKQVFGGGASGLDTKTLLEDLATAKRLPAVRLEERISANTEKMAAYSDLNAILSKMKTVTNTLRNVPGVGMQGLNLFGTRTPELSTSDGTSASNFLTMDSGAGASLGSHTITITNIAAAKSQRTGAFTSQTASVTEAAGGATAGMFSEGTVTLNALGTNVDVEIEEGDSLLDIRAKINNVKDLSGVEASILQVSSTDYRLVLKSTQTGLVYAYNMTDATGVFAQTSLTNLTAAANANFTIDGVALTRASNTVTDAIDGLTFTLKQATGTTVLTSNVKPDVEAIVNGISNFVDVYNEFRTFVAEQQRQNENGVLNDDGVLVDENGDPVAQPVLFGDPNLQVVIDRIASELNLIVDGITSGDPDSIGDIGLSFTDYAGDSELPPVTNILTLDTAVLESKLNSDFDGVRRVFEFDMISDSANLSLFSRTNALSVTDFELNINFGTLTATATYDPGSGAVVVPLTFTPLSGGGATIEGQAGTPFEGLVLIYGQTMNDTIDVHITQGIGDRLYNSVNDILDDDGLLAVQQDALTSENDSLKEDISRIDDSIERFRDQLLERFASLESAIASINTLLQSLQASADARNNA